MDASLRKWLIGTSVVTAMGVAGFAYYATSTLQNEYQIFNPVSPVLPQETIDFIENPPAEAVEQFKEHNPDVWKDTTDFYINPDPSAVQHLMDERSGPSDNERER